MQSKSAPGPKPGEPTPDGIDGGAELVSRFNAASADFIRLSGMVRAGIGEMSFSREMIDQLKRVECLVRRVANWRPSPIRKARGARGRKRALKVVPQ